MKISVVMPVFNGAATLRATIDSILAQTERDFELLIVDDGSSDDTPAILASYGDPRLRVLTQRNSGLTRALIRACAEARGAFIARHDCGDRSMPARFATQQALIEQGHVLVSCATRYVDPEGDELYVARAEGDEVRRSLLGDDAAHVHGIPAHGSAMFRRDAYFEAGGYREQFAVAQDLDLWLRLAKRGTIAIAPEVLYELRVDARSISSVGRAAQLALTEIAVALRDGGDTRALLANAARVTRPRVTRRGEAAGLYFIGKNLLRARNKRGIAYLRRAIARNPLHWRAWLSLIARR